MFEEDFSIGQSVKVDSHNEPGIILRKEWYPDGDFKGFVIGWYNGDEETWLFDIEPA